MHFFKFKEPFINIILKNIRYILLIFFALFVIISFSILIHGTVQQEQSQERLFIEEKAQLTDMTSYLNKLDDAITVNQDRLTHSLLFQTDTEQTLLTYQEQLSLLEKNLSKLESAIKDYSNTEHIINNEISLSLT